MIPLKAVFVISVLISGLIFSPSYSFAQSNQDDNPLSSLFEMFMQLFSFDDDSEPVIEFGTAVIIQSSNSTPIADAGNDQTVMEFEKVTLDGSSSTDPDGDPISYKWTQTTGPEVFTDSMTTVESPMFMAPGVDGDKTLTFELVVVDTSSATSEVDVVIVKVTDEDEPPSNENSPPTADAGDDQTVMEFEKVTLDGSSSTDPDGDPISYKWTQLSGAEVTLSSMSAVKPTFTAPDAGSPDNILKFMLAVVDNSNDTDTDEVIITVNEDNDNPGDGGPGDGGPGNGGPGNGGPGNGNQGNENSGNDNRQEKVTLCHVPPGNPPAAHTITVGAPAVDTHLEHHDDYLGPCVGGNNNGENNENKKSNSGKGNKDKNDDKKDNSGKGNSDVNNSGKGNQNDKDENKKSNSEKGNKNDNEHKSNSKLKNNNDDEAKVEDNEHENEDENEDEHEDDDEDDGKDEDD